MQCVNDAARARPASSATTSSSPSPAAATTCRACRSPSCRTSTASAPGRRCTRATSRWTAPGRCYEAWMRLQVGDIDVALVIGSGKSSPGTPRRGVLAADRPLHRWRRSGSTRCRWPASRPGRSSTPGMATEADFAEVVSRSRARRARQSQRAGGGGTSVDELLAEPYFVGAAAPARPAADLRRRRRGDHRRGRPGPRARPTTRCGSAASTIASSRTTRACATSRAPPSTELAAAERRRGRRPDRRGRADGQLQPRGDRAARRALGLGRRRRS